LAQAWSRYRFYTMSHPFLSIALCAAALAEGSLTESTSPSTSTIAPWTRALWMPEQNGARANFYAAGVNGKVYAMGGVVRADPFGDSDKEVLIYDSATKEWLQGPEMMHGASTWMTSTVSVVGDNIYVIGGGMAASAYDAYGGMVYDTSATQFPYWSPIPEMSIPRPGYKNDRIFYTTVAVDTKIYAIGGSDREGDILYGSIDVYDTVTKKFSLGPNMTEARYGVTAAVIDTKIYIMGGMNGTFFPDEERQGRKDALTSVMLYDTATDKWSTAPDMLVGLVGQRAASVDGKIYVIGGEYVHGDACNKTQIFDPATNQWTMGPDMIESRGADFGVAVLDGNIYALGGLVETPGFRPAESRDMEFLDTRNVTVQVVFSLSV